MILHPGILALLVSSLLISLMTLYAAGHGVNILRGWDLTSGSDRQLALERRTYLVSTIVGWFLVLQVVSLFLLMHTADSTCRLFIGAMCAVGTLTANSFGYPTLLLKAVTCILAGLWLILDHADSKGYDYPLIRAKYLLLLLTAPLIMAEAVMQALYFFGLEPDVITSCCGNLFSQGSRGIASEIIAVPSAPMKIVFYVLMLVTCTAGVRLYLHGKSTYLFAGMSAITFIASIVSIISFISLYFYQMPSHHCPFCLLQKEYGYVGYPLYLILFLGTVTGLGTGVLEPHRKKKSLEKALPALQNKLAAFSVWSFFLFTVIVTVRMLFSSMKLGG